MNWAAILEVQGKQINAEIIDRQYRLLAKKRHPDAGGSNEAMTELNLAKNSALKWIADQLLIARQAEAAKKAAEQASHFFQNAYMQQMANSQSQYAAQMQQQMSQMWRGIGQAGGTAGSPVEEEKRKTKWERVREILRGKA
jgi:DnaJ-class molecular chaperone